MAGKLVNRLRVQGFKSRRRSEEGRVADGSVTPRPEATTAHVVPPPKREGSDRLDSAPDHPRPQKGRKPLARRRVRLLAAPLVWLCLLAFCGGTAIAAFLLLTTLPPATNCQTLQPLAADTDQLYCADQAARSGRVESLLAGLALVKGWSVEHPLHNQAERAVKEWSKSLLAIAQTKADQGDLAGAIALAKKIPASSSLYPDVQVALRDWQKSQNRGQAIDTAIQTDLQQQDWKAVTVQLQNLSKLDDQYARQNLTRLRQQLTAERAARQQLQKARQVATRDPGSTAVLGQAIALAEQLKPGSYAYTDAQIDLRTWGQFLLNRLTEQLGRVDTTGAIATAKALPASLPLPPVARDLVWLSHAQPLAASRNPTEPVYGQFWQLWTALAQVDQIQADSPLAAQIQSLIPRLKQQSQALLQIQLAMAIAKVKQLSTLQAAIALMETITPAQPQRIYAQTLIAQWRKEIQQIEDRPYLIQAQQLATAGTIPKLKAAIAQARQIAPKRALRLEAQSAIAKWTRQIQTIEDRPLLDQAQALAKQQKLTEAIQIAAKIRADRALYKDAQAAINDWTVQIQLAEDQPLLNEARALADQGRLTRAIDIAAQIGSERALYGEAQNEIARWSVQRDAILRARRPRQDERSPQSDPDRSTRRDFYRPSPSTPSELPPP